MGEAKKQAIHDMSKAGVRVIVLYREKEILEATATSENQKRPANDEKTTINNLSITKEELVILKEALISQSLFSGAEGGI